MNTSIDASIPVLTEIILPATGSGAEEETTVTAATTSSSPLPDA
jgi:hypothetical protein